MEDIPHKALASSAISIHFIPTNNQIGYEKGQYAQKNIPTKYDHKILVSGKVTNEQILPYMVQVHFR